MTITENQDPTATTAPRRLEVDVLVIGWGKGGKTFAGAMAGAGRSVAIVEQSSAMYGGTCINIGCVPTKTLIHDAAQRREGDEAADFFRRAVDRRDTLIAKLNEVNLHMLADRDTVTVVDGRARFVGPREVEVTPSAGGAGLAEHLLISASTVVINTGAVPALPSLPGVDGPGSTPPPASSTPTRSPIASPWWGPDPSGWSSPPCSAASAAR